MAKGLLLKDLLQEYLLELQLKNYSIHTLQSVKDDIDRKLEYEVTIEQLEKH